MHTQVGDTLLYLTVKLYWVTLSLVLQFHKASDSLCFVQLQQKFLLKDACLCNFFVQ
jgi:hypothetical protein